MPDESVFADVIGRAVDLLPDDYVALPTPVKEVVALVPPTAELQKPSPTPFVGRPDPDYPDLDSGEALYIPRYLVRRWRVERFERSAYLALWKSEAGRARESFRQDLKPERKKKP